MNWYLLIVLSALGLPMGALSVRGLTHRIELWLWVLLGLFAALAIAKNANSRWALQALLVGIAWGLLNALLQSLFFESYSANNAEMLARFNDRPSPVPVRYFLLLLGPLTGAATGIVIAGLTFVFRRMIGSGG
jgi:hypothetical protein